MSTLSYDPKVADEYTNHLSEVNRTNSVVVSEDIVNEQGVLLVKKGARVSAKLAQQMIQHKLSRPLEQSVNLENVLDAGRLYKQFHQLFEVYPDCRLLHQRLNLDTRLKEQCRVYNRYPLLTQKLTVLAMRRQDDFQKSLFCAWFALAIADRMRWTAEQLSSAFLAGLMHDIGMLHIPEAVLTKQGELSAEEWRAIQSHPLIAEVFLKGVPDLPRAVWQATAEHHERLDGSGYPVGKFQEQLSIQGQLIAIADTVFAVRMQRFGTSGRSLNDLIPILQLNQGLYVPECYRAAVTVLREVPERSHGLEPAEQMPGYIQRLLSVHRSLCASFELIPGVIQLLPEQSEEHRLRTAICQLNSAWFAVASSGLLSPSLQHWMSQVKEQRLDAYYLRMEEIGVMQQEVLWLLRQLRKSFRSLVDPGVSLDSRFREHLCVTLDKLDALESARKQ